MTSSALTWGVKKYKWLCITDNICYWSLLWTPLSQFRWDMETLHLCPLPCSSSCLSVKDVACPDLLMKHWNSGTEIILRVNIKRSNSVTTNLIFSLEGMNLSLVNMKMLADSRDLWPSFLDWCMCHVLIYRFPSKEIRFIAEVLSKPELITHTMYRRVLYHYLFLSSREMPQRERKAIVEEFFLAHTTTSRKSHSLCLGQVISGTDSSDD